MTTVHQLRWRGRSTPLFQRYGPRVVPTEAAHGVVHRRGTVLSELAG